MILCFNNYYTVSRLRVFSTSMRQKGKSHYLFLLPLVLPPESSASSSQFLSHSCPSPPRHSFSKGLKRKRNGRSLFFFFQTKPVVPDSTTTGQSDPLDPLSSLMSGTPSQRYQDYVSPRSLSTDSSTTESPVHEEQGFGQNYGNYFPTPGVLPSILYSQLYGNQFQNSESPEQRAVADSCSVRQEEVRPDNNVWRPY